MDNALECYVHMTFSQSDSLISVVYIQGMEPQHNRQVGAKGFVRYLEVSIIGREI